MKIGFVPEPAEIYRIAPLVARESHVHWLMNISHEV
uniref:BFN1 n=1 Tax=Arundo donax TaxID=35708 RepID=A0A0A9HDH9_ARUDO